MWRDQEPWSVKSLDSDLSSVTHSVPSKAQAPSLAGSCENQIKNKTHEMDLLCWCIKRGCSVLVPKYSLPSFSLSEKSPKLIKMNAKRQILVSDVRRDRKVGEEIGKQRGKKTKRFQGRPLPFQGALTAAP